MAMSLQYDGEATFRRLFMFRNLKMLSDGTLFFLPYFRPSWGKFHD